MHSMLENKNILGRAKELRLAEFSPAIQALALGTRFYANSAKGRAEVATIYNMAGAAPKPHEEEV